MNAIFVLSFTHEITTTSYINLRNIFPNYKKDDENSYQHA